MTDLDYDDPNLICTNPDCDNQFAIPDLLNYDPDSYEEFADELFCPSCNEDLHPEDALMEFYSAISLDNITLYPFSIGGYCLNGEIEVELGKTKEHGIIQQINNTVSVDGEETHSSTTFLPLNFGLARLWGSEGQPHEELFEDSVNPRIGPVLIHEDTVFADVDIVEDDDSNIVVFATSNRGDCDNDMVSFAYHLSLYSPRFQGPPWIELLREGLKAICEGNPRTAYPSLITAFDNFLLRQLYRTAKASGESKSDFDSYIDSLHGWRDYVKEGLEEYAGERLTLHNHTVYHDFQTVRKKRSTDLVHVSYDDNIPLVTQEESIDDLKNVLRAMVEVYSICKHKRRELAQ